MSIIKNIYFLLLLGLWLAGGSSRIYGHAYANAWRPRLKASNCLSEVPSGRPDAAAVLDHIFFGHFLYFALCSAILFLLFRMLNRGIVRRLVLLVAFFLYAWMGSQILVDAQIANGFCGLKSEAGIPSLVDLLILIFIIFAIFVRAVIKLILLPMFEDKS